MDDAVDLAEEPQLSAREFDATDVFQILNARRHPLIDQCKAHAEKCYAAAIRVGADPETASRDASAAAAAYLEGADEAHAKMVAALDAAAASGVTAEEVASVFSRSRKASFEGLCRAIAGAAQNRH